MRAIACNQRWIQPVYTARDLPITLPPIKKKNKNGFEGRLEFFSRDQTNCSQVQAEKQEGRAISILFQMDDKTGFGKKQSKILPFHVRFLALFVTPIFQKFLWIFVFFFNPLLFIQWSGVKRHTVSWHYNFCLIRTPNLSPLPLLLIRWLSHRLSSM